MKTIADYLKGAPRGTKLYTPLSGECTLLGIDKDYIAVKGTKQSYFFTHLGQFFSDGADDGECLLFPSKEERDWGNYKVPYIFKPFDKIVARNKNGVWVADMFSHYVNTERYYFVGLGGVGYDQCLLYNEETSKLIGTADDYAG